MQEFLKTVARHYAKEAIEESQQTGVPASMPLAGYLFCFPNRRCGLFFAKHLREAFGQACFVPSITTISELYSLYSDRHVPDRTTLLFRLFRLYRQLSSRQDKEEFDQFVFWGDMLLSDFDDVDKYLVDADALFRNVKDLKDIEAEFAGFEPEIVAVIQSFWHNYKPVSTPDDAKREAFGQTWCILRELYHAFRQELAAENLAYEGMLEREVIERLTRQDAEAEEFLPSVGTRKIVFVGLTAISKADRKLLLKLQANNLAEFCWDYADPRLQNTDSKASSAAYFSVQNLSDFPNALSAEELQQGLVPEEERQYELFAVPSAVGQTHAARQVLLSWAQEIADNPLHTAVVLPDERLLLPMLYAVPHELGTFNVTMGYGLKETPIATFVELLANLQDSIRVKDNQEVTFYFKPVLALLSHNFVRTLANEESQALVSKITSHNLYQVSVAEFEGSDFLRAIFQPVTGAKQALDYLLGILHYLMEKAAEEIISTAQAEEEPQLFTDADLEHEERITAVTSGEGDKPCAMFSVTDHEFLFHYNRVVERLSQEVESQDFTFTARTLFLLLQKLVAGVSVPFTGEPLQGIQLMGVLETRGMDFENLVILSMNEGIFPAKPSNNTFIPMSLRNAFGLPTQRHHDAVYAYHFYRLISRARRVTMVYDSRAEGMQTGEESRYVKQLRLLMGHPDLQPKTIRQDIRIVDSQRFEVQKTPEVLALMQQYLAPNGKHHLSASALNSYIKCPMSFYLGYVENLRQDDEVSEGVDNRHFGDILHHALCNLYLRAEGQRVDADMLQYYIDHPEGEITQQIAQGFREVMGVQRVEGYNLLVMHILVKYAVAVLEQDKRHCPFVYLKGESKHWFDYKVNDQLTVKLTCVLDRLDRPATDESSVRIVDYKTGSSSHGGKLVVRDIDELFTPDGKASHEAFQVMFYSLLLDRATPADLKRINLHQPPQRIEPNLFFVRDFKSNATAPTMLNMGKDKQKQLILIDDFSEHREAMTQGLNRLIESIFDPSQPFVQCEKTRQCLYCPFNAICKR